MANRCVHRQIPMAIKSPMPLRLVMEVSSPYPFQLHESCPAGLYTGWLQTAVGIDTGCPPGQTIYSGSAPAYNGSLILFLLSQGTITPNYGWQNPSMNWYVGASSPSFSGQSGGPCN